MTNCRSASGSSLLFLESFGTEVAAVEEIIKYILNIDKMARDMTAGAEEMKAQAQAGIPAKKEKLRAEFLLKAQERIRVVEESEKKFAEDAFSQRQAEFEKTSRSLEAQYTQNRECWVRQLVDRVIQG